MVISNEDFHYENLYLHYTSHCNFYHERHVLYLQQNFVWIWIPEMKTTSYKSRVIYSQKK